MEPFIFLFIFLVFFLITWAIASYNRFIKYKNMIEEKWSGIDVSLKRRYNLIPNLINATKGYSAHESKVLNNTVTTRSEAVDVSSREEEESQISRSLCGIIALAEAYPDLKASANFLALQDSLNEVEEEQKARAMYNYSVRKFYTLVESFPSSLIALKFGFIKKQYFSLELATQRELPEADY